MQLCGSLSILWHCLSLGLERKLTFSSPLANAEFSQFAGILSAALSQCQHQISQMVDPEIRLIIVFAAIDGEALYSQQKQDRELTVAQLMSSLLANSDSN